MQDLYKPHYSIKNYICFYCNTPASGVDHYPPKAYRQLYPETQKWLIRCCRDCNRYLGVSMQDDLEERIKVALLRFK